MIRFLTKKASATLLLAVLLFSTSASFAVDLDDEIGGYSLDDLAKATAM